MWKINGQTSSHHEACTRHGIVCVWQANSAVVRGNFSHEVDRVVAATRRYAESLGLPILDSYSPSLPRWFASWDGAHYTFASRVKQYPDPPFALQWQGGVSHMSTMVYINMLCNTDALRPRRPGSVGGLHHNGSPKLALRHNSSAAHRRGALLGGQ